MITNIKHFLLLENVSQMRKFLKSIGKESMEKDFDFVKDKFSKTPNLIYPFVKMMFIGDKPHIDKQEFELVSNWVLNNKHLIKELPKNIQNYKTLEELQDDIRKVDVDNGYKLFYNSLYRSMKEQIDSLDNDKLENFKFLIYKFLELPESKRKEFPPLKYFEANRLTLTDFKNAVLDFIESGVINSSKESILKYVDEYDINIIYNNNNILIIQTNDKEHIKKLGSQNWCIVYASDTYYSRYIGDNVLGTQYILYNFNLPSSSDLSQYGISIKLNGDTFSGGCQDKINRGHNLDDICNSLGLNRKEIFTTSYKYIEKKVVIANNIINSENIYDDIINTDDDDVLKILFKGIEGANINPLIPTNSEIYPNLLKHIIDNGLFDKISDKIINIVSNNQIILNYITIFDKGMGYLNSFISSIDNLRKSTQIIDSINNRQDLSNLIDIKNILLKCSNTLNEKYPDESSDINRYIDNKIKEIYSSSIEFVDNIGDYITIYKKFIKDEYIFNNILDNPSDNVYDVIINEECIKIYINKNGDLNTEDRNFLNDIINNYTHGYDYELLEKVIDIELDSNGTKQNSVIIIEHIYGLISEDNIESEIDKLSNAWLLTIRLYSNKDFKYKDLFDKKLRDKLELDNEGYSLFKANSYNDFKDFFDNDNIDFEDTFEYFDWDINDDDWSECISYMDIKSLLALSSALYNNNILDNKYKNVILKYNTPEYLIEFNNKNDREVFGDGKYDDLKELKKHIEELFNDTPDDIEDDISEFKEVLSRGYNRAVQSASESDWFNDVLNELKNIFTPWDDNNIIDWSNNVARFKPLDKLNIDEDLIDTLVYDSGEDFDTDDLLRVYFDENGKLETPDTDYESPDNSTINEYMIDILSDEYDISIKTNESNILKFNDFILKKD